MTRFYFLTGWLNLRQIVLRGNTSLVRLAIAVASLMWAILLIFPQDPTAQNSPPAIVPGIPILPIYAWVICFVLHGTIAVWAIMWQTTCKYIIIGNNILGCTLWTGSAIVLFVSHWNQHPLVTGLSAEVTMAIFSWWLLLRNDNGRCT